MHAPIFIVGANRSGTTLLRLMLNAHSRIAIPEELLYFQSCSFAGTPVEEWRTSKLSHKRYAAFVNRFLQHNCGQLDRLDHRQIRKDILEGGPHDFRRPYQLALEHWARRHGKERWGEKTPGNLFYVEVLLDMFPKAQFIHLVRDPRAGVHSMNKASFFSSDTTLNALNRRKYVQQGLALQKRLLPTGQWTLVRYEDLVDAPEATLRSVCSFLGETFEPNMLRFHEDAERYMKGRAAYDFNRAATGPVNKYKIDSWRDWLSSRDVTIIEAVCGEHMHDLGYARENQAPLLSVRLEMLVKTAYFHRQCRRHASVPQHLVTESLSTRLRRRGRRLLVSSAVQQQGHA